MQTEGKIEDHNVFYPMGTDEPARFAFRKIYQRFAVGPFPYILVYSASANIVISYERINRRFNLVYCYRQFADLDFGKRRIWEVFLKTGPENPLFYTTPG